MATPFLATIDRLPTAPRSDWAASCIGALRLDLLPGWRPWTPPPAADEPHAGIVTQKAGACREVLS